MIGDQVKKFRKEKGLSITELAEKAGIAKSYLSSIERNIQTNPSVHVIEKISTVLGVSVEVILNEDGEKSIDHEELDPSWLEIVKEAMDSGISKEQFREFLEFTKWKNQSKN